MGLLTLLAGMAISLLQNGATDAIVGVGMGFLLAAFYVRRVGDESVSGGAGDGEPEDSERPPESGEHTHSDGLGR